MPKAGRGGIKKLDDGTFKVRVSYVGNDGKRHERLRKNILTRTEARKILKDFTDNAFRLRQKRKIIFYQDRISGFILFGKALASVSGYLRRKQMCMTDRMDE